MRKKQAFTLIELMVVVAIIAILATLAVSNFSVATKKTRNTQRVNDMKTAAEAMETCYDLATGKYATTDPFGTTNACLNAPIISTNPSYPYTSKVTNSRDGFVLCAKLEPVSGVQTIGNSAKDVTGSLTKDSKTGNWGALTDCADTAQTGGSTCYYCVMSQQ